MINGIDVTESSTGILSLNTSCSWSGVSITCYVYHTLSDQCYLNYLSMDVVVYHWGTMIQDLGYDFLTYGFVSLDDSSASWYLTDQILPYDDTVSFYGFTTYTSLATGSQPIFFNIYHIDPYLLNINLGTTTYRQSLAFMLIYCYTNFTACPAGKQWIAN